MDISSDIKKRVAFIKEILLSSGAKGIIFGNSGGKDSALVGILSKMATSDVLGVMMPCHSKRNYGEDLADAKALADKFSIETRVVDLTDVWEKEKEAVSKVVELTDAAMSNVAPRLRMTTLYLIAQSKGYLVAGTGNKSEAYMGYFTKWGDGAHDLNPIADLTVSEIYEYLKFLGAPESIINKAPSAGLFDGQTDEGEMGVTYKEIDDYMSGKPVSAKARETIERFHARSEHKRNDIIKYKREEKND